MKKNFKALAAAFVFAVFPFAIFAQNEKSGFNLTKKYKAGAAAYATNNEIKLEFRNDVPIRAVRNFISRFDEVTNLNWQTYENGFMAKFIADGIETRVEFDMKGCWVETINTYTEENMPADVKRIVKDSYKDFTVLVAHRIETPAKSWYVIKIENKAKLKTLQVKGGEMELTDDYIKG